MKEHVEISDIDKKLVAESTTSIAKTISKISELNDRLEYMCRKYDFDDEVCYNLNDGLKRFGVALAILVEWLEEDHMINSC